MLLRGPGIHGSEGATPPRLTVASYVPPLTDVGCSQQNYFRAKNAPAKPNDAVQQRKGGEDLIFGDLAKKGAGAFAAAGKSQRRGAGKAAKTRFLAHKMFGKVRPCSV